MFEDHEARARHKAMQVVISFHNISNGLGSMTSSKLVSISTPLLSSPSRCVFPGFCCAELLHSVPSTICSGVSSAYGRLK